MTCARVRPTWRRQRSTLATVTPDWGHERPGRTFRAEAGVGPGRFTRPGGCHQRRERPGTTSKLGCGDGNAYPQAFRSFVATGATDDEIAGWIGEHAKKRPRVEIIAWNNKQRDQRLSELSPELQEYMEDYIAKYIPRNRVVYHWFDVYDLEEERL